MRVLAHDPHFVLAEKLLKDIQEQELKEIFNFPRWVSEKDKKSVPVDDVEQVIAQLTQELGIGNEGYPAENSKAKFKEVPHLPLQEQIDVAIAYFEMDCFSDALRELETVHKRIRIEQSFLGPQGVLVVSLISACLIELNRAYEARAILESVIMETDLAHEDKTILYYQMGCVEQALQKFAPALEWFEKIVAFDPYFKDSRYRANLLRSKLSK